MASLAEKLRQLLRQKERSGSIALDQKREAPSSQHVGTQDETEVVTADNVARLMFMLNVTREEAYSCEETFALLDEYVEVAVQNETEAEAVLPLVKHHLDLCPDCHQKFSALLQILKTEYS